MINPKFLQFKILPFVIFLIAAFFRIFNLDLIEFKYDEAYTVFELNQFFAQPYLMQVGPPQSTGVYNPPLFNYIMIVISLFSRDPQFLSFVIALINTIFIVIFYLVVKKFYGQITSLFVSLLYALSPWSIIFSRKIWIPDLLQPLIILFIYFFHLLILEKREKAVLPLFFILVLLPQMHASGLFFLVATFILLLIFKIKINYHKAFLGIGLGLIPAIPYLIRQLTSKPFCIDCAAFFNYQETARYFDLQNFIRPLQFLGGNNFQVLLGHDYTLFLETLPFNSLITIIFYLELFLPLGGVLYIIFYKRQHLFLLFYPLIIPLFYFLSKTPSYMHYFIILNPFIILLAALSFGFLWNYFKKFNIRFFIASGFGIILIANLVFNISFNNFLSYKQNIAGDYGPVFPLTKKYIQEQTSQYLFLPFYDELKSYGYMFAQTDFFHQKMGEYLLRKNLPQQAIEEFKKALFLNSNDKYSRANLTYIYLQMKKFEEAEVQLNLLSQQDATLSARLQLIYDQLKNNR